jgi:hypothetical protein
MRPRTHPTATPASGPTCPTGRSRTRQPTRGCSRGRRTATTRCSSSIVPEHGRIELGHIWFSPALKRTPAATEAIYLLSKHAFENLGYRRLEWKCNALNANSYNAALRFGFEFEGVFHNHMVVKGRNRDSAYFAITGSRWPAVSEAFERWLAPENFDEQGAQLTALRELTAGRPSTRA